MATTIEYEPAMSLREQHRAVTRSRIVAIAGTAFFEHGYDMTTMEQIAKAAVVSRSTLYAHFQDKAALLEQIAADYGSALSTIVDRLPSPVPSRAEIGSWIEELATFIGSERASGVLIVALSESEQVPEAVTALSDSLLAALGSRLPGFGAALREAASRELAMAWGTMVMRALGWACFRYAKEGARAAGALLLVAGDVFDRFVQTYAEKSA